MRIIFCGVFLLGSIFPAKSQYGQRLVDSLQREVRKASNDTVKAKLFTRLSDLYIDINQDVALSYADSSSRVANKLKWKRGKADALLAYGNVYNFNGNPDKAIGYLKDAISSYKSIDYKRGEGLSLLALGVTYERISDYSAAILYYFQALQIHESLPNGDWEEAMCLSNISVIYYLQGDFKKSLDYSFKALNMKETLKNKTGVANELYNIGDTYTHMNDSTNAIQYNLKALSLFKELGNKMGEGNVYFSLGKLFRKNYRQSLESLYQARKVFFELGNESPSVWLAEGQIGEIFLDMAKLGDTLSHDFKIKYAIPLTRKELLNTGEIYLQRAVQSNRETGDKEYECAFIGYLAETQALKGDFKNAYSNYKTFHTLRDSIYSQESKNKIAAIEGQREVALRDKEIELNKLALSAQRKQNFGLILGLGLVLVIGSLLYRQNRIRKKTNASLLHLNSQLDEANKVKAKFFAILSHDLRSPLARLINFLHLQKEAPDLLKGEQASVHQQKIVTSAEALLENMETVLLWGKGQMVNFKPVKKKIAIGDLFKQLDDAFKGYEKVQLSFSDSETLEITTDENYLITIMQNLTANAIKVLHGTSKGLVLWKAEKLNDGKVILSITDNGTGLSEDQKDKLLNGQEITGIKDGFGFHIVRDLAKAIECTIEVESISSKGTTFRLHC